MLISSIDDNAPMFFFASRFRKFMTIHRTSVVVAKRRRLVHRCSEAKCKSKEKRNLPASSEFEQISFRMKAKTRPTARRRRTTKTESPVSFSIDFVFILIELIMREKDEEQQERNQELNTNSSKKENGENWIGRLFSWFYFLFTARDERWTPYGMAAVQRPDQFESQRDSKTKKKKKKKQKCSIRYGYVQKEAIHKELSVGALPRTHSPFHSLHLQSYNAVFRCQQANTNINVTSDSIHRFDGQRSVQIFTIGTWSRHTESVAKRRKSSDDAERVQGPTLPAHSVFIISSD